MNPRKLTSGWKGLLCDSLTLMPPALRSRMSPIVRDFSASRRASGITWILAGTASIGKPIPGRGRVPTTSIGSRTTPRTSSSSADAVNATRLTESNVSRNAKGTSDGRLRGLIWPFPVGIRRERICTMNRERSCPLTANSRRETTWSLLQRSEAPGSPNCRLWGASHPRRPLVADECFACPHGSNRPYDVAIRFTPATKRSSVRDSTPRGISICRS